MQSLNKIIQYLTVIVYTICRSQWPRGLRHRSLAARLLRSWVRIPPGAWIFVCCECCVLSGRGLCDELITRPEESYRLWCVIVCDLETSWMRRPWPTLGHSATKKKVYTIYTHIYYKVSIKNHVLFGRFKGLWRAVLTPHDFLFLCHLWNITPAQGMSPL